jgi:hypothetical protein
MKWKEDPEQVDGPNPSKLGEKELDNLGSKEEVAGSLQDGPSFGVKFLEVFKNQGLWKGTNLVQMKHTGSFKAYMLDFNAQMNAAPKMDEFSKKFIFLGGLQKWVVDALFKFPKLLEDVAGIIKIAERIEADGSKIKSSAPSQ